MCGRYGLIPNKDFYERFEIVNRELKIEEKNNASPGMFLPVITANSPKKVEMMKWGLVPHWAKNPKIGYKTFNARSEDIENKPAFRKAFKSGRCLVPANGFYEWNNKIPFWIKLKDDRVFAMAGIYDIWTDAEGYEMKSFAIITTEANNQMSKIHDRMPVIMDKNQEEVWLDKQITDIKKLKSLLIPYSGEKMQIMQVKI